MYCVSHAALIEPVLFPFSLLESGQHGHGPSSLSCRIRSPGSVSRAAWLGGSVLFFPSCAAAVDEYRRPGVLPLFAHPLPQLIASRRFTPPDPRALFVSADSAPRFPSCAAGVGLYFLAVALLAWLVRLGPLAKLLPDCSQSCRTGVSDRDTARSDAANNEPPPLTLVGGSEGPSAHAQRPDFIACLLQRIGHAIQATLCESTDILTEHIVRLKDFDNTQHLPEQARPLAIQPRTLARHADVLAREPARHQRPAHGPTRPRHSQRKPADAAEQMHLTAAVRLQQSVPRSGRRYSP